MTDTNLAPAGNDKLAAPFDYSQFEGSGFENADNAKDLSIPFVEILQNNSKALTEGHAKYRPGAKSGMFLNTGTGQLLDGKAGFNFVPIRIDHCVVEWTDQRKFVGRHEVDSPVWKDALERFNKSADVKKRLSKDVKSPAGNQLVETYYLWALMLDADGTTPLTGVIIPFKSTNIAIYRKQVYTPLYSYKMPGGPRLFVHRMKCTLALEQRADGNSWNYRFEPLNGTTKDSLIDPSSDLMKAVYSTFQQIAKGDAKMAEPDAEAAAPAAAETDEVFG